MVVSKKEQMDAIVRLREAGKSYREIADETGWSLPTITRRLSEHRKGIEPNGHNSSRKCHNLEEFISMAREVHGDRYDYSKSVYVDCKTPVEICCPDHGPFWQKPNRHLSGRGCPHMECINRRRELTRKRNGNFVPFDEFVKRSNEVHGNKYDYSKVKYIDTMHKVEIVCPIHGSFFLTPQKHMQGAGCTNRECFVAAREQTMLERYGVKHALQSDEFISKCRDTYVENDTFNRSSSEDLLYQKLCDCFGVGEVIRQFCSDRYPYPCDFYIPGRDLYIELNVNWTHGMHWFDGNSTYDSDLVRKWSEKGETGSYYKAAINCWCDYDVSKREAARAGHLNYIVFWDFKLRDVDLWIACGCPDGHDWDREYSWFPESIPVWGDDVKLTGGATGFRMVARKYQFPVFYKRELDMWSYERSRGGLPIPVYIYHNRWKYLGKLPHELSGLELMNAFTISGLMKGYTSFDVSLMDTAVKKYGIQSVYDPCAGWGERMLYCFHNGIPYMGVDVNRDLGPGYARMVSDLGIHGQSIRFGDSASIQVSGEVDAVVTCPPYGDTEIYSEDGAENLPEDKFLEWWGDVVKNSLQLHPKYFCVQLNQKYYEKMVPIVEAHGFSLAKKLDAPVKSSHMTRRGGKNLKKEYESMAVLVRG